MKYIVANFKQNGDKDFITKYAKKLNKLIKKPINMLIALPSAYLYLARMFNKNGILVGAQNISAYISGAYTGEIGANMATDLGASFTLIGHSERRNIFGESNEHISKKLELAKQLGLKAILCVGESLQDKSRYKSVIGAQLKEALKTADLDNIIIAYEPIWAIGTGKTASSADADEVCGWIRDEVRNLYGDIADEIIIQYGGSVKSSNARELFEMSNIDGGLVGGASLEPEEFSKIVNY